MAENEKNSLEPEYGPIDSVAELGALIRAHRKSQGVTLEKLSNMTRIGTRFLSELERGKQTAEIGKTLQILSMLGITLILEPRNLSHKR